MYTVPATPMSDVCAVYDMMNGTLQIIESTWIEVVRMYVVFVNSRHPWYT